MNNEIISKTTTLTNLLDSLDKQRDDLWNLKFKDFEDLARAIDSYDDDYGEAEDLLSTLANLLTRKYIKEGMDDLEADSRANDEIEALRERVNYHFNELLYFRQKRI